MNVFLTGATGLIGRHLAAALVARGDTVTGLSRSAGGAAKLAKGVSLVVGDPSVPGAWQDALAKADACVHLAGDPIVEGRWTDEKKRRIRDSRVVSTGLVAATIAKGGPGVLVSGSAVGWYGDRGDEVLDEGAAVGTGFLPEVCKEWEDAAAPAAARARTVLLRTGIVLSPEGGALPPLVLPFKLFAGGPLGSGRHWQPWIHLADMVRLVLFALDDARVQGPLNCAGPEPVQNRELARAIGRALNRPSIMPAPELAIRAALGEAASVVLASQRVVPKKALDLGFRFEYPTVDAALRDLLGSRAA
ncbi:MAG: TIGR01777 family oxidoreductase [Anaeromyxobacter sp.]